MEKRLHPVFQEKTQQTRIQTQFDPTPESLTGQLQKKDLSADPKLQEALNEQQLKINRFSQRLHNTEMRMESFTEEMRTQITKISSRFNEVGLNHTKIESMMERHNSILHAFEKRINQMVKLLENSQTQLLTTQAALEDARREIMKLKRL